MDFGLNRFHNHNHHSQPRAVVDLMMMESSSSSPPPLPSSSVFEVEEANTTTALRGVEDSDNNNNNNNERIGISSSSSTYDQTEKEHMFDKVVTPSDVGKLNRLVIPKQHAERYFPLDSSSNDKGLLLNFEDRNGKSWRFRYSYWNSSQSYVMTKGWSRFVKEKRLDAGDIVSFERGVGELARDRLYIDWRRRPDLPMEHPFTRSLGRHNLIQLPPHGQLTSVVPAWNSLVWRPGPTAPYPSVPRDHSHLSSINNNNNTMDWSINSYGRSGGMAYGYGSVVKPELLGESAVFYLRSGMGDGGGEIGASELRQGQEIKTSPPRQPISTIDSNVYESVPVVVHGNIRTPKRSCLRLFGVNMEEYCPISTGDECELFLSSSNQSASSSSTTITQLPPSHG